jgi:hypothetical protein
MPLPGVRQLLASCTVVVAVVTAPAPTERRGSIVKLLRRALSALALAGLVAGVLRARGTGGTPPQHGGWRPLEIPDT